MKAQMKECLTVVTIAATLAVIAILFVPLMATAYVIDFVRRV